MITGKKLPCYQDGQLEMSDNAVTHALHTQ